MIAPLLFGGIAFISILITGLVCKEYDVEECKNELEKKIEKEKHSAKELLGYMFKNRYTVPLIFAFVINWFALSLVATATVYFARDILGDASYMQHINIICHIRYYSHQHCTSECRTNTPKHLPKDRFIILFFICTILDVDKKVKALRAEREA